MKDSVSKRVLKNCLCLCTCRQYTRPLRRPTTHLSWPPPAPHYLTPAPPQGSTQTLHHGNGRCRTAAACRSHGDSWTDHRRTAEGQPQGRSERERKRERYKVLSHHTAISRTLLWLEMNYTSYSIIICQRHYLTCK